MVFGAKGGGGINPQRQPVCLRLLFFMDAVNQKFSDFKRSKADDVVFEPVVTFQEFDAIGGDFQFPFGGPASEVGLVKGITEITDIIVGAVVAVVVADDFKIFFQEFFPERRGFKLRGKADLPAVSGVVHFIPIFKSLFTN